jgi:hypothetical protein
MLGLALKRMQITDCLIIRASQVDGLITNFNFLKQLISSQPRSHTMCSSLSVAKMTSTCVSLTHSITHQ